MWSKIKIVRSASTKDWPAHLTKWQATTNITCLENCLKQEFRDPVLQTVEKNR